MEVIVYLPLRGEFESEGGVGDGSSDKEWAIASRS